MRLGQAKQVTIVRYVVQKTVEQYIQDMQARKIQLAELGFDNALEGIDEERLEKLKACYEQSLVLNLELC